MTVPMLDLTPFTSPRAKLEARTIVIQRIEVNFRLAMVLLVGMVVGIVLAGMTWWLLAEVSIVWVPAAMVAAWWFLHRRDRRGLRLRGYQSIKDRVMARNGQLYVAGQPVTVNMSDLRILLRSSVPVVSSQDSLPADGSFNPDDLTELLVQP